MFDDVHLGPFDSLRAEYGPDPRFDADRYRSTVRERGPAAALSAAVAHYLTRLCEVRDLLLKDGSMMPWIDDGEPPTWRGEVFGRVVGDVRYIGTRRQCREFLEGRVPAPSWVDEMGL